MFADTYKYNKTPREITGRFSRCAEPDELMMKKSVSDDAASVLDHGLTMIEPLVAWLVHSGVGYTEFSAALKTVFFKQALQELEKLDAKPTNSAISLLAGLHRQDVKALKDSLSHDAGLTQAKISSPVSVPARVVGHWIADGLATEIPFSGEMPSFEALVRRVSQDLYPRAILNELKRLDIVDEQGELVILKQQAFIPKSSEREAQSLLVANVSDHLAAGVHNLTKADAPPFVEQAIYANELSLQSVQALTELSTLLWQQIAEQILQAAIKYCAEDEGQQDALYRFRFGAYQFAQQEQQDTGGLVSSEQHPENKP